MTLVGLNHHDDDVADVYSHIYSLYFDYEFDLAYFGDCFVASVAHIAVVFGYFDKNCFNYNVGYHHYNNDFVGVDFGNGYKFF